MSVTLKGADQDAIDEPFGRAHIETVLGSF